MKKSTKGALAAGAAAVLLMGGVGTVAYWSDSENVTGGSITSGHLALTNPTAGAWTLNGQPVADATTLRIVPGDQLEYAGSFEIDAVGDNLEGEVTVEGGAESGPLAEYVDTTLVSASIDGAPATTVTEADDGKNIDVVVGVDFPFGDTADNRSNQVGGLVLDLSAITVTVTQTDPNATP